MAWGSGYVTDIAYVESFFRAQTPQTLALSAILNGFEAPDLSRGFTYCELGCGKGLTSLVLAAANAGSEFHAIDFNPAHIAYAQSLSSAAAISNVAWHEMDFAALSGRGGDELPMFDIVTMHGIWSWIAPELQDSLVRFLERRVKPGGLVYVGYNAMPGWNEVAPVQRVIKELSAAIPGRSDRALTSAVDVLKRLVAAKIIPDRFDKGVKRLTDGMDRGLLTYLTHEYLNAYWKPLYHVDVARSFAQAKLQFVGATSLLQNFDNLALTPEQAETLKEVQDPDLRETLKDFCTGRSFREDVYVRGARKMSEGKRDALLRSETLSLIVPAPGQIAVERPGDAVWRPDSDAYGIFVKMLEERPRKVGDLLAAPEVSEFKGSSVEVAGVLIGTGLAAQFRAPDAQSTAACGRLNDVLAGDQEIGAGKAATVTSAALGIGLTLPSAAFDIYAALRRGKTLDPAMLARRFDQRCREEGTHPVLKGKLLENTDEALPLLAEDFAAKIEKLVPIWRMIGIV